MRFFCSEISKSDTHRRQFTLRPSFNHKVQAKTPRLHLQKSRSLLHTTTSVLQPIFQPTTLAHLHPRHDNQIWISSSSKNCIRKNSHTPALTQLQNIHKTVKLETSRIQSSHEHLCTHHPQPKSKPAEKELHPRATDVTSPIHSDHKQDQRKKKVRGKIHLHSRT